MVAGLLAGWLFSSTLAAEPAAFRSAKPIWPTGRETEMNLSVGFRAVIDGPQSEGAVLRVAASTIYRAWLNGEFLGCGPARAAHGYFRIDQWDLSKKLRPGKNVIALEVAGYNANSYYLLDQPSFLQAEVVAGDKVLASTAGEGSAMEAGVLDYRVQKVQRYSFQRPFVEVYRLSPQSEAWRSDAAAPLASVATAVQGEKRLLARRVLYPDFDLRRPVRHVSRGQIQKVEPPKEPWKDRSLTHTGPALKGYPEKELVVIPTLEMQALGFTRTESLDRPFAQGDTIALGTMDFEIVDLGVNDTGFFGLSVECSKKCRVWLAFDEILSKDDVDFRRLGCANILDFQLEPGTYRLESIEPYTARYVKLMCLEGECQAKDVYLRQYGHPAVPAAQFASSDPQLNRLFEAGVTTFRQNTLDIFMDCPSRERAGWLCDSFFTSRVACDLTGTPRVEHNFVENFLLPERFEHLPEGMLPMCYPSDHNDGIYIPNWALWFVVQLEEFAARGGDPATVRALEPRVLRLMEFFQKYENEDGLLEKLPSWVFVEWSAANQFVQDVNYPSNMLYAGALSVAGRIYQRPELIEKADRIRQQVRRQSFDGRFFVDNAVRKDGKLQVTQNRSEVCQYFAFFFDVATPQTHAELWQTLQDQFGPDRKQKHAFPEVHEANSFVGNMLRMELLSRVGRSQQILDESIAYLLYMADRTGTLWENVGDYASCDHGFASHICHTLYRDVLGIARVDSVQRRVVVRIGQLKLDWCEGRLPTPDGPIHLRWSKDGGKVVYQLEMPKGYEVEVENLTGTDLVRTNP
jgi:alpha-L-rhamnosidase